MSNVRSDLRHGVRVLLRTPLFTICTIAALAIGIGATTALFSVVHALLIKPLPYKNAESLVVVWEHNLPRNRTRNVISPANFLAWRERSRSFESPAASSQNRVTLPAAASRKSHHRRTANVFDTLGVARCWARFASGRIRRAAHDDPLAARGCGSSVDAGRDRALGDDQRRAGDDRRHHAAGHPVCP